ncbi:hypothetical protein LP52_23055 [Streptomonospora alba]|uniref:MORN repeat variant n=1 Tax=Streptomonospora alba TaxID=183763 RepID=A0A0C2JIQ9_9ACTN|nr:hypothetical protein [Streptomonospora alba]KIH96807.1 hypothetical protein LP52_23055 [Streptomonospora alba]
MKRVEDTELEYDDYVAFYNGEVYTGEAVELGRNGEVIALTTYERGFEHGPSLEWYPGGQLREEGRVDMSRGAVGVWKTWHKDGTLAAERTFDDHGRMVSDREWDADGNVVKDKEYSPPR